MKYLLFVCTHNAGRSRSRRRSSSATHHHVPVRSFVLTLAERRIRECLREAECAVLA